MRLAASEAPEVVELGDQAHRGHGVDAAEAAEPCHGLAGRVPGRELGQLRVELRRAAPSSPLDREQVGVERRLARAIVEARAARASAMCRVPQCSLVLSKRQ